MAIKYFMAALVYLGLFALTYFVVDQTNKPIWCLLLFFCLTIDLNPSKKKALVPSVKYFMTGLVYLGLFAFIALIVQKTGSPFWSLLLFFGFAIDLSPVNEVPKESIDLDETADQPKPVTKKEYIAEDTEEFFKKF